MHSIGTHGRPHHLGVLEVNCKEGYAKAQPKDRGAAQAKLQLFMGHAVDVVHVGRMDVILVALQAPGGLPMLSSSASICWSAFTVPLWPHPCGVMAMIPRFGSCTRPDASCSQADSLGGLLHQLLESLAHGCRTAEARRQFKLSLIFFNQIISECRASCCLRYLGQGSLSCRVSTPRRPSTAGAMPV